MTINTDENLFTSSLSFTELDALSVSYAKEKFLEYQEYGVIKPACSFNDKVWFTTDEYSNVGLYFNFNKSDYKRYELLFGITFSQFTDFVKTFAISIFGKNVLGSIECTLLDIKHLMKIDVREIWDEKANLRLYSANRLIDFLSLLITDENDENMNYLIESLEFYSMINSNINSSKQRELAPFNSYLDFDDILNDYWNSNISEEDRLFYYPLYIWWKLTAVIPLRPREFLLLERNCLIKDNITGKYTLKLRRNQLKGGENRERFYKIIDAYLTVPQPVPDYIGNIIDIYLKKTQHFDPTDLNTLFVTDPHYRKWNCKKNIKSRFLTYVNLNTILKYFYVEVIKNKYGYKIYYNNEEINHENKEIHYIHLGDARHIAFFNLMEEGANPVTAMLLGGHTNIEMASHYYSNVISFIECKTYRQYRKMISGKTKYQICRVSKLPPIGTPTTLADGTLCYSKEYRNHSEKDCLQAIGPNGELGWCNECTFHRRNENSYFSNDEIFKHHIQKDCKMLLLSIQSVMEEKGNLENIQEAILNLNSSRYSYRAYLEEKLLTEKEDQ